MIGNNPNQDLVNIKISGKILTICSQDIIQNYDGRNEGWTDHGQKMKDNSNPV